MERKVEWRNAATFFEFLFLSKLQFCLFGLLLTSPINEGIKVNNTFSSFHFSAFANQTNFFFFPFSFPSLLPNICQRNIFFIISFLLHLFFSFLFLHLQPNTVLVSYSNNDDTKKIMARARCHIYKFHQIFSQFLNFCYFQILDFERGNFHYLFILFKILSNFMVVDDLQYRKSRKH